MSNRKLIVEVIVDPKQAERGYGAVTASSKAFAGTVKEQAQKAIVARVQERQSLEKLALEYRRVAQNAAKGSEVQITAARLAEKADRQLASSYGVVSVRSEHASRSAKVFERDLGHATRGALAGSGVFRGLGRSLAFASGGFLAFASAGDFIRKSIDAAKEAQVTQAQLSQQLKNGGKNFAHYRDEIDRTNLALSSLSGFTKDELDASLTTILRTTGNVSKALRDNALAADIARARHISLAAAATIVAKTEAGNTTLLRRQGIQIAKNATVEQALAAAHRATAGQARAGTTEQERFGAVLHDTEVIIGTGLLPSLNQLLTATTNWLSKMNESGSLTKNIQSVATVVSDAFSAITNAASAASGAINAVNDALGGFGSNNGSDILKALAGKLGTGDALIGSPGHRGFLGDLIGKLGVGSSGQKNGGNFSASDLSHDQKRSIDATGKFIAQATARATRGGITAAQRNRFFDSALTRSLDRVQDLGLNQQVGRLQQISASITKRIAATKDITRKLNLEDQLVGVNRQIKGVRSQIAQNVADRVQSQQAALAERIAKAKEAAAAAAAARAARNQSAQFKALGLSATGSQIIPVRVLKAQLGRLTDQVSGTLLDTTKTQSLFANIRKIFAGGFGALTSETKSQIKQMLDGIDAQLKQHSNQTKFRKPSARAILSGLGLSPDEIRALTPRLAQIGVNGTAPGTRSLAFGAAGASNQVIQLNVDGVPMARVVTKHQQRAAKRQTSSRRGTYAGHH